MLLRPEPPGYLKYSNQRQHTGAKQTSLSFQEFHKNSRVWPRFFWQGAGEARLECPFFVCKGAYMAGSRRDMEGGPPVPPRDRGRPRQGPVLHRPISQAPQPHPPARVLSAGEARGQLERELAALSLRPLDAEPAPAMPVDRRPPAAPPGPVDYRPAPPRPEDMRPGPAMRMEPRLPAAPPRPAERWPAPPRPADMQPRPAMPMEPRLPAAPPRPAERWPAPPRPADMQPAPAMPMEHRLPAAPPRPAEHRPAPPRPGEQWPVLDGGRQAARQERVPYPEENVPYTSLMAALSTATPAMLTEAEKSVQLERTQPSRAAGLIPQKAAVGQFRCDCSAGRGRVLIGLRALDWRWKGRRHRPGCPSPIGGAFGGHFG